MSFPVPRLSYNSNVYNLVSVIFSLLQVLALEMPQLVWLHFSRWFRTLPNHGYPTEQIVRLSIQSHLPFHLMQSRHPLLLAKLLASKFENA